jgi:hypothetical protein
MTKSTISAVIETDLLEEARKQNINISRAAEEGLRMALNSKAGVIIPKRLTKLERVWEKLTEERRNQLVGSLQYHGDKPTYYQNLIMRELGIKLSMEETYDFLKNLRGITFILG